jgi:hypothetical protein
VPRQRVIFVFIGDKLPKYANASLALSEKFSGLEITLLGNSILKKQITNSNIEYIDLEDFYDSTSFLDVSEKINLPLAFRNGFWHKAIERLFVLHQYMEVYKVQDLFHAELDQILFRCDKMLHAFEEAHFKGIALPFHAIDRGVASVLYCNDIKSLKSLIDFAKELNSFDNEMVLISQWAIKNPHMIKLLPTLASEVKNIDVFNLSGLEIIPATKINGVVDAAQIGQWIGGQDPRNVNIRDTPKNKYVESPSEEILSYDELSRIDLSLDPDKSLMISYDKSIAQNLYNIHLHSKLHPWIIKSGNNIDKVIDNSNRPDKIAYSASRWIQVSSFVATGFESVVRHPVQFLKRSVFGIIKLLRTSN